MNTEKIDLAKIGSVSGILIATAVFTTVLLAIASYRAYPFNDNVNPTLSAGNDWLTYKENAVSILRNGLAMPKVASNYARPEGRPGGFLYNYFVAAVFALTGINSTHVYLVQTVLLGFSVGLMALAFRPFLSQAIAAFYFLLLAGLFFLEVFCIYTFRLLSENLVILLLALFCFLAVQTMIKKSLGIAALAGVAAGMCALCRPNLVLLPLVVTVLFAIYLSGKARLAIPAIFLIGALVVFALMPLRNYVATKQPSLSAITYTRDWDRPEIDLSTPITFKKIAAAISAAIVFYGKRVLFCFGLTFFYLPIHWLRPHWIIIWAGAFLFCRRAWQRRRLEFWQAFAITFVAVYLGPLIAVAQIYNYGVRMIVPVLPVLLVMAVAGFAPQLERLMRAGKLTES
ncbi:MAG TPA: glycosyltransferase family 39 protein [Pyrinomonadaceae bacterium]|nr:glycosyltransferase family 39 protein [Pyrinomonadaceae bacterium]